VLNSTHNQTLKTNTFSTKSTCQLQSNSAVAIPNSTNDAYRKLGGSAACEILPSGSSIARYKQFTALAGKPYLNSKLLDDDMGFYMDPLVVIDALVQMKQKLIASGECGYSPLSLKISCDGMKGLANRSVIVGFLVNMDQDIVRLLRDRDTHKYPMYDSFSGNRIMYNPQTGIQSVSNTAVLTTLLTTTHYTFSVLALLQRAFLHSHIHQYTHCYILLVLVQYFSSKYLHSSSVYNNMQRAIFIILLAMHLTIIISHHLICGASSSRKYTSLASFHCYTLLYVIHYHTLYIIPPRCLVFTTSTIIH